jgi:serine protease Do
VAAPSDSLPDLVQAVLPAVVSIDVHGPDVSGNGSGFAIVPRHDDSAVCVLVTDQHVVAGAETLAVRFYDDSEHDARVRVVDVSTDVAILEVDAPPLATLAFRPLREVRVGEPVIAVGSPYGLAGTVTSGIVSGLDRTMYAPNGIPIDNMIQTDALINPGNSGGPLIGLDGLVVGINDQIRLDERFGLPSGLGFAIPGDTVQSVYAEICETGEGRIRRATIGARTQLRTFTLDERKLWGQKAGALLVDEPLEASPARAAGLARGDVVVELDGNVVDEPGDLYRLLDRGRIGKECPLAYIRGGAKATATIVPQERQDAPDGA